MPKWKEWLSSSKTANGYILAGAVLTLAVNTLISLWLINISEENSKKLLVEQFEQATEMARQAEINARSKEIRDAAADFSTFAASYVTAMLDEPSALPVARRRLTENVLKQISTVTMTGNVFEEGVEQAANQYKNALFSFREALIEADNVLQMRPFWESASDVLAARDVLLAAVDRTD